jgi:hypothetical protein
MSENRAVIAAIREHHRTLAGEQAARTTAALTAAADGDAAAERAALVDWYHSELIPHALAEEKTLYAAAASLESTRLLVRGMLAEHELLIDLINQLADARQPQGVVAAAASARALFESHLAKENDLLLPALDAAGVNLAPLLAGMEELLGAADAPEGDAGCGCGCSCGTDT